MAEKKAKPKRKRKAKPKPKPRGKARDTGKGKGANDASQLPKGKNLTTAQKSVRDTLIVERRLLGWEWPEIAAETGLSIKQCQRNFKDRVDLMPKLASMDPLEIIEVLVKGFQSSVIDFERMAMAYADRNPSAAVGAKRAAVDTREKLGSLLQSTGQLPHDLGTLHHIYEIRVVAKKIVELVQTFEARVKTIDLPEETQKEILGHAGEISDGLRELVEPKVKAA